jgi:hypothetical protein
MNAYAGLFALSLSLGAGLLSYWVVSTGLILSRKIQKRLWRGKLQRLGVADHRQDERNGNAHPMSWKVLYGVTGAIGCVLFFLLQDSSTLIRLLVLFLPAWVYLLKRYLALQRKRFELAQVRQFLVDVRLHMSLQGSLLLGLEHLAKTTLETAPVYRLLHQQVNGKSAQSGVDLIKQVADQLENPHLKQCAQRIQACQRSGGLQDMDQAIASTVDFLNEEINSRSEEELQKLPLRITMAAMPLLLAPIVILLFYPLVDHVLNMLSGVSLGNGF